MPTRNRVRAKPVTAEAVDFDPNAVTGVVQNPPPEDPGDDGTIGTEPEFYDSQTEPDPSATNALGKTEAAKTEGQQAAMAEVRDFMRRMENLLEERDTINEDIKELKKEFKDRGYDMTAMGLIVKIDRLSDTKKAARKTQNGINATYAHAAGIDEDLL